VPWETLPPGLSNNDWGTSSPYSTCLFCAITVERHRADINNRRCFIALVFSLIYFKIICFDCKLSNASRLALDDGIFTQTTTLSAIVSCSRSVPLQTSSKVVSIGASSVPWFTCVPQVSSLNLFKN
jgi:hypothetical protein